MELYHKQLKSVADLKREQKRLKGVRKVAKESAEAVEETESTDNPFGSIAGIAGDFLTSKGASNTLMSLALPLFQLALRKAEKGFLKKVAKEVIGGYVKWKAIDFGVTLAMRFVRRQKYKAEQEAKD